MIAERWNVRDSGEGYVTRFRVRAEYISRHEVNTVGGRECQEYWIPAEDLPEFNANVVGLIEVVAEFRGPT